MKRRKHRIVVEVTADEACTEKAAAYLLYRTLDRIHPDTLEWIGITKLGRPKQFTRVARAASEVRKNS